MRIADMASGTARTFRRLVRRPVWSSAVILTLALGVGGLAAVWSLSSGVLWRPLGYAEAERLVRVSLDLPSQGMHDHWLSPPEFFELAEADAFDAAGAYVLRDGNVLVNGEPLRARIGYASAGLLEMLAPRPAAGRLFGAEEDRRGGPGVALLGHGLWTRLFGASDGCVGEMIEIDGESRTVVGVLPEGFDLEERGAELLVPLGLDPAMPMRREARFLYVLGRLAEGATPESATDELSALAEAAPRPEGIAPAEPRVRPLREALLGRAAGVVVALAASVALVLILATVDLLHLFLARRETRRREMALRSALGARRLDLVGAALAEILLLALPAAFLGWLGARWGLHALIALHAEALPRLDTVVVDARAFAVALGVALLVALAVSVLPDLLRRGTGSYASDGLDADSDAGLAGRMAGSDGPAGRRFRRAVVVAETALATVLTIAAALVAGDLENLLAIDPGFEAEGVTTARISLPFARFREPSDSARFFEDLVTALEERPGVAAAGALSEMPLERDAFTNPVQIEGRGGGPETVDHFSYVTPGVFRALGVQVLAGRAFEAGVDHLDSPPVAVVSEAFARAFAPEGASAYPVDGHGDAVEAMVGRRLRVAVSEELPWVEIVGVAGDIVQVDLDRAAEPEIYLLQSQATRTVGALPLSTVLVARARTPGVDLRGDLREAVRAADPTLPLARLRPLEAVVEGSLAEARLLSRLIGLFAFVALGLAIVGIYGVLSFAVERRSREMGVRQALGARPVSLIGLVLGEGLGAAGLGVALGLAGAGWLGPHLAAQVRPAAPGDLLAAPWVWLGMPCLLLAVSAVACLLPAWRAARLGPAVLSGQP